MASTATSFTMYSKSSKMAIGNGPSPVITSVLPGQPEITWHHQQPITEGDTSNRDSTICINETTKQCYFKCGCKKSKQHGFYDLDITGSFHTLTEKSCI